MRLYLSTIRVTDYSSLRIVYAIYFYRLSFTFCSNGGVFVKIVVTFSTEPEYIAYNSEELIYDNFLIVSLISHPHYLYTGSELFQLRGSVNFSRFPYF